MVAVPNEVTTNGPGARPESWKTCPPSWRGLSRLDEVSSVAVAANAARQGRTQASIQKVLARSTATSTRPPSAQGLRPAEQDANWRRGEFPQALRERPGAARVRRGRCRCGWQTGRRPPLT